MPDHADDCGDTICAGGCPVAHAQRRLPLQAPFPWFGVIEVHDDGSIWRITSNGKPCTPRRIDVPDCSKGYRNVVLPVDDRWRTFKAHRIVWWWHNGSLAQGMQINHRNLNKDDNRLANLEEVTPAQNIAHSYANGRTMPWSRTPAPITEKKESMRQMRRSGALLRTIAAEFGCSIAHAHRIVSSKEVPGE